MNEMGFPQYAPPPEQAPAGPMYAQAPQAAQYGDQAGLVMLQYGQGYQAPAPQAPAAAPQAAQPEAEGGWQHGKQNGGSADAATSCDSDEGQTAAQAQYMYQAPQAAAPQQGRYMSQGPAPQHVPQHEQYMYQAPPMQAPQPAAAQYMYGQPQQPQGMPQAGPTPQAQPMYQAPQAGAQSVYGGPAMQPAFMPGQPQFQAAYGAAYQVAPGAYGQPASHDGGSGCGCGKHDDPAGAGAQGLGHMMGFVNDLMSGRTPNPSAMVGMLESCSAQFWKGAAVGAALAVLLTNNAVKDALTGMVGGLVGSGQSSAPQGE